MSVSVIKCSLGGDTRRVAVPPSFAELKELLANLYQVPADKRILISYQDDEGDSINLTNHLEWTEACRSASNVLHLTLSLGAKTADISQTPAAVPAPSAPTVTVASPAPAPSPSPVASPAPVACAAPAPAAPSAPAPSAPTKLERIVERLMGRLRRSGLPSSLIESVKLAAADLTSTRNVPKFCSFLSKTFTEPTFVKFLEEKITPLLNILGQPQPKPNTNFVCDGCDNQIVGPRFHCTVCPDYDLCNTCRSRGLHNIHPLVRFSEHGVNHPMWRQRGPCHPFGRRIPFFPFGPHPHSPQASQPCPPPCCPPQPEESPVGSLFRWIRDAVQHPNLENEISSFFRAEPPQPKKPKRCAKFGAKFVCDVTVDDGTVVPPKFQLIKTWRLKNTGTVAWPLDAHPVMIGRTSRNAVEDVTSMPLEASPAPDQDCDISVLMTTPSTPGTHTARFRLSYRDEDGSERKFGPPFWVTVHVSALATPTSSPSSTVRKEEVKPVEAAAPAVEQAPAPTSAPPPASSLVDQLVSFQQAFAASMEQATPKVPAASDDAGSQKSLSGWIDIQKETSAAAPVPSAPAAAPDVPAPAVASTPAPAAAPEVPSAPAAPDVPAPAVAPAVASTPAVPDALALVATPAAAEPEFQYAKELRQLQDMGFNEFQLATMKERLVRHHGNCDVVIAEVLGA